MTTAHEYFTIQHKRRSEGPWLQLDKPLATCDDKEWHFSSPDFFGAMEPWYNKPTPEGGTRYSPKFEKSYRNKSALWQKTGRTGWTELKYAIAALKRLIKADDEGDHDSFDSYGKRHQRVRHHFRIVKVTCYDDEVETNFLSSESINQEVLKAI